MRYVVTIAVALLMLACSTATNQAKSTVEIYRADRQVGSFVPRDQMYHPADRPAVIAWLPDPGGKVEDERIITAVKFIGWREGGATRVQAYALVTQDRFGNFNVHNEGLLTPRLVGDFTLQIGESVSLTKLMVYHIEPMEIRIVPATPGS